MSWIVFYHYGTRRDTALESPGKKPKMNAVALLSAVDLVKNKDQEEYDKLCSMGEPVPLSKRQFATHMTAFHDKHYNEIVRNKWSLIASVLGMGVNALISDIDVVWFRDPLPGLSSTSANCSMLFSSNDQKDQNSKNC